MGKFAVPTGYLHEYNQETPNIQAYPAILVLPGGGFRTCSYREGEPVAMAFYAEGYQAFVLKYTVVTDDPNAVMADPMRDICGAMEYIRSERDELLCMDGINEEGLLYSEDDRLKVLEKFKADGADGLMLPHCNFGTEYVCARLAKDLCVPVLLWGPLDERPEPNGVRLRDTQCGLFATGKVLRRFRVSFTYLTNCRLNDPVFERAEYMTEAALPLTLGPLPISHKVIDAPPFL